MPLRCLSIAIATLCCLTAALARGQDEANGQIQQYVQLLLPSMWRELDFVRQVCDLTPEQRPKIKAAADAAVKAAAKNLFQPQRQGGSPPTAAAQAIHDGIHEALKKALTSEQLERYLAEDASRTAATKNATIRSVVSRLDGVMFLTTEQREEITAALNANWQRDWEHWLTMHQYGDQYFPQIPDQHVAPHLNSEQKVVWGGLQKTMIYGWHHNGRQQAGDAWWDANPAQPAKAAKGKSQPAKGKGALLQPAKNKAP
jgi:hypothetical protein